MKFTRNATAKWNGSGKEGSGTLSTQSTVLDATPYSYKTRFEEGKGTNPEELVAAAHAGCFTMQLSFLLGEEGQEPESLETTAKVHFEDGAVSEIGLFLTAKVPGMAQADVERIAQKAKEICPISKLLNAKISLSTAVEA